MFSSPFPCIKRTHVARAYFLTGFLYDSVFPPFIPAATGDEKAKKLQQTDSLFVLYTHREKKNSLPFSPANAQLMFNGNVRLTG